MEQLEKLAVAEDVPLLTRAWEHNGEILGITTEGKLVVVARIVEPDAELPKAMISSKPRAPRRRPRPRPTHKDEGVEASTESEER